MYYDIIGDIHGYAKPLVGLLHTLGYHQEGKVYRHPERTAIFLGDFIDLGPDSRSVLEIVRSMVEAGTAHAILGNHEFNAICYHTPDGAGGFLRPHNSKNNAQHQATLASFASDPDTLLGFIEWFKSLPLWLEISGFRVVHACWNPVAIETLRTTLTLGHLGPLNKDNVSGPEAKAMKLLCKGHEINIPGLFYPDKHGQQRSELRIAWWINAVGKTCRQMAVKDEELIPEVPFPEELQANFPGYTASEPLLFMGHYSLDIQPTPLLPNLVCVDLGVTGGRGLAAYRWRGEKQAATTAFLKEPVS